MSLLLFTLPFPLSFSASSLQHWEQMSPCRLFLFGDTPWLGCTDHIDKKS